MGSSRGQLGLFALHAEVKPVVRDEDRALASRIPRGLRFGTSSWSFPGWAGLVYAGKPTTEQLAARGLEAYAAHPLFRTVSLDRATYAPVPPDDLASYGEQLRHAAPRVDAPPFRMLSKVWDELTTFVYPAHPRYGARARTTNPFFLDAGRFVEHVLAPSEAHLGEHLGPYVVELTPMPPNALSTHELCARVERFALEVGPRARLAFELRNQEHLGPRWFETLAAVGAAPVFTYWTAMPSLRTQLAAATRALGASVVVRLMLPPFTRYEDKQAAYAPFDKIAIAQPEMRDDTVRLVLEALDRGAEDVYVLVNNKAEGSAPLTVRALCEAVARG